MRKGNDGYVLAFVMVVLLVLSLSAVSLLSLALGNLQRQSHAMEKAGIVEVEGTYGQE